MDELRFYILLAASMILFAAVVYYRSQSEFYRKLLVIANRRESELQGELEALNDELTELEGAIEYVQPVSQEPVSSIH